MSDLRDRTKQFAVLIVEFFTQLPKTPEADVIGKQLLRSGTSIGAHYREAYRSRSSAEYISKLEVGLQELEETAYWLELLVATRLASGDRTQALTTKINELTAIFVTCVKSARHHKRTA